MNKYEQYAMGLATQELSAGDATGDVMQKTVRYTKAAALASIAVVTEMRELKAAIERRGS